MESVLLIVGVSPGGELAQVSSPPITSLVISMSVPSRRSATTSSNPDNVTVRASLTPSYEQLYAAEADSAPPSVIAPAHTPATSPLLILRRILHQCSHKAVRDVLLRLDLNLEPCLTRSLARHGPDRYDLRAL